MDDNQKSRLMIIAFAGVLLLGGGGWWIMTQNQNAEKAELAANTPDGTAPGTQIAANPAPANPANPTDPAANPAGNPAPTNPAATPVATNPPANPAPANPPATPVATNPPATPAPTNPPATPAPANPPATPAPANPPAPVKPATPQPAQTAPAQPATPVASQAPPVAPANPVAATTTAPAATQTVLSSTPTTKRYPATRREEAIIAAKQVAGREDPMFGTFEKTAYPAPWTKIGSAADTRTTSTDEKEEKEAKEKAAKGGSNIAAGAGGVVPPPPPPGKMEKPVPPPPPSNLGPGGPGMAGLPPEALPAPPDKPLVTPQLKLTAIVGNKAVLSVPLLLRSANKWPEVICLGPGEKFEDPDHGTFSVVQVDRDSVTIEEDQERSVKSLPQIK